MQKEHKAQQRPLHLQEGRARAEEEGGTPVRAPLPAAGVWGGLREKDKRRGCPDSRAGDSKEALQPSPGCFVFPVALCSDHSGQHCKDCVAWRRMFRLIDGSFDCGAGDRTPGPVPAWRGLRPRAAPRPSSPELRVDCALWTPFRPAGRADAAQWQRPRSQVWLPQRSLEMKETQEESWRRRMTPTYLIASCDNCYSGKAQEATQMGPGEQGPLP